ncbi:ATP-binding protein [Geoalkalibacter halelectricus]|uniref:Mg-protoporphyrin IX chelatase n=1 Tax=Geoalkalibacter halelectricus TaxID=2847045 RepID=A0ABY5ZP31_9BACT|nr:ATP-binding protein [Geoalkalibacter halelectricus]MDO3379150.1 ATP-binding protein [Geoalkalibacter halelectricus]UWZ80910.1 ATP-binding protein [Geoalkalibacter halelectricus]
MKDAATYPFSAIIGQEELRTALLLNAVDPAIGGVLIQGHKGTGKSTVVRSLAALLPEIEVVADCPFHCPPAPVEAMHDECAARLRAGETLRIVKRAMPLVDLPLAATEDRVVGTLHLEKTLESGRRHFEPGLLAAANRGILYVDEVNLLPDHLVDLLLDAAATGVNRVEREGVSVSHPARFLLVGTMNPEEGELRPQFLDRFGLCVWVRGIEEVAQRREVVRRRMAFEENPAAFVEAWAAEEDALRSQVVRARAGLNAVVLSDAALDQAVRISLAVGVQGHRSDLAIARAARALAALLERREVGEAEIFEAALLVLPHRIAAAPPGERGDFRGYLQALLAGEKPAERLSAQDEEAGEMADWGPSMEIPGATAAGSQLFSFLKKKVLNASSNPTT